MPVAPSALYLWGKAHPASATGPRWHPLAYHSLDVACVTTAYLVRNPSVERALCVATGWSPEQARQVCFFLGCAHDLGKAHPGFQSKAPELFAQLFPGATPVQENVHHSQAGLDILARWLQTTPAFLTDSACACDPDAVIDRLEPILNAACGHHGRPQAICEVGGRRSAWLAKALEFMDAAQEYFGKGTAALLLGLAPAQIAKASPLLAGVLTVCDWVGSSQVYFGYVDPVHEFGAYVSARLPLAHQAVESLGLAEKPPTQLPGFAQLFPGLAASPSPLQAYADTVVLEGMKGPRLFILEDETGAGKTEAALTLASRLVAHGAGRGVLYTLPTQTTANAIFQRAVGVAGLFFEPGTNPSLVLRHGASDAALRNMRAARPEMGAITGDLDSWANDSSKTSLLADFGVCTIDQVVLSALPTKHFVLRQLGLAQKVLIVDEAHACEPYLLELLASALRIHAGNGGSAILLSATLPREAKHRLLSAFATGAEFARVRPAATAYPLATCLGPAGLAETPVAARRASRWLSFEGFNEADLTARVGAWLEAGKCVAVIRNTVRSAQALFDELSTAYPGCCELMHAKFVARHRDDNDKRLLERFGKESTGQVRRGRVVVATQVVEQSLDVDFDELVTDLAPLDALLQRAGRWRRHVRNEAGAREAAADARDARAPGAVHVVMPAAKANPLFLAELPEHTAFVYPLPAVLWRTARYLQKNGGLTIPEQVREAVDYAYSPDIDPPAYLLEEELDSEGKVRAARQKARFVALDPALGYSCRLPSLSADECVTRLGEPSIKVVLCDTTGAPLFGDKEASRLSLRASLLALTPADDGYAVLHMQSTSPGQWHGVQIDRRGRNRLVSYGLQRGLEVSAPL